MAIMLLVLANLNGQNPQLREGAEQFLSNITAKRAVIGEMVYLGFIPDIRIEIKNVDFQTAGDPTDVPMQLGSLDFAIPLMHYILNKKTIEKLSVTKLEAKAGALLPKSITLRNMGIIDDMLSEPFVSIDGKYGEDNFNGRVNLVSQVHKQDRTVYRLPDVTPLLFETPDFTILTSLQGIKKGSHLKDLIIKDDSDREINADLQIKHIANGNKLAGTLAYEQSTFDIDIDITREEEAPLRVTGKISASDVAEQDIRVIDEILSDMSTFFMTGEDGARFFALETDIQVNIAQITCGDQNMQNIQLPVAITSEAGEAATIWARETLDQAGLTGDSPCAKNFEYYLKRVE